MILAIFLRNSDNLYALQYFRCLPFGFSQIQFFSFPFIYLICFMKWAGTDGLVEKPVRVAASCPFGQDYYRLSTCHPPVSTRFFCNDWLSPVAIPSIFVRQHSEFHCCLKLLETTNHSLMKCLEREMMMAKEGNFFEKLAVLSHCLTISSPADT